jgi:hypothetical protein
MSSGDFAKTIKLKSGITGEGKHRPRYHFNFD